MNGKVMDSPFFLICASMRRLSFGYGRKRFRGLFLGSIGEHIGLCNHFGPLLWFGLACTLCLRGIERNLLRRRQREWRPIGRRWLLVAVLFPSSWRSWKLSGLALRFAAFGFRLIGHPRRIFWFLGWRRRWARYQLWFMLFRRWWRYFIFFLPGFLFAYAGVSILQVTRFKRRN